MSTEFQESVATDDPLKSVTQVAEALALSKHTIRNLIHDGAISAVLVGGVFRISTTELTRVRLNGTGGKENCNG